MEVLDIFLSVRAILQALRLLGEHKYNNAYTCRYENVYLSIYVYLPCIYLMYR